MRKELFDRLPRAWNRRVITEDDVYEWCQRDGILVRELDTGVDGFCASFAGRDYIVIDPALTGLDKLTVLIHEYAHCRMHARDVQFFAGWDELAEGEADVAVICALVPLTLLRQFSPREIAEQFGYSLELAQTRLKIYRKLKI